MAEEQQVGEGGSSEAAAAAVEGTGGSDGSPSLDLVLDIPLEVTVEIGRTRLAVRELLALGQGSVVTLSKPAGEPLDILVNGRPIARGEAVLVGEKFGVRLTDVISPSARVERLR